MDSNKVKARSITMCFTKTIFQAEVMAIEAGLKAVIREIEQSNIPPIPVSHYSRIARAVLRLLVPITILQKQYTHV